jgi:signal transduction histidine kinase
MNTKSLKFINDFTHELKSPLASIKALVVIIKNTADPAVVSTKLDRIDTLADKLNNNIESLFLYMALESGRFENDKEPFEASPLVKSFISDQGFKKNKVEKGILAGNIKLFKKMLELIVPPDLAEGEVSVTAKKSGGVYNIKIDFETGSETRNFDNGLVVELVKKIENYFGCKLKTGESGRKRYIEALFPLVNP